MPQYTIRTGGQRWKESAPMASQAVEAAFRKRPPKNPGLLTSVSSKGETEFFVDTIKYLKLAGYEVKESNT